MLIANQPALEGISETAIFAFRKGRELRIADGTFSWSAT
jgi:hypothetical protein